MSTSVVISFTRLRDVSVLFFFLLIVPRFSPAQQQLLLDSSYVEVRPIAQNIYFPWEIIWGADQFIWMTHPGQVSRVNPANGTVTQILELTDFAYGEGSRQMGLALDENFQDNHFVYVDYNYAGEIYNHPVNRHLYMKIVRFKYNTLTDKLEDPTVLLDGVKIYDGYHDGGKLICHDGYLFLTIGDAKQVEFPEYFPDIKPGDPFLPQDLNSFNGKVIRINLDGSVPTDNPFAKYPYEKTPRNLIWTYGHRNTQGLTAGNGKLYYAEHGKDFDDECGILVKGMNYGWPLIEGYCDSLYEATSCDTIPNHHEPIRSWTPNVAPSNMEYVGTSPIGEFQNAILVGTLTGDGFGNHIAILSLDPSGQTVISERGIFQTQYGRIRDFCVDPGGNIYFITSNTTAGGGMPGDDKIIKLSFVSKKLITGITETKRSVFNIFPNPATSSIVEVHVPDLSGVLVLTDMDGELIQRWKVTSNTMTLELPILASGVYVFRFESASQYQSQKIVIDKR